MVTPASDDATRNRAEKSVKTFFVTWRRRFGIATLLAAAVLTGAWIKSAVDNVVIDRSAASGGSIHLAGKIAIFAGTNPIEWPGHLPQIEWRVAGIYNEAIITIAPPQVLAPPENPGLSADNAAMQLQVLPIAGYGEAVAPSAAGNVLSTAFFETGDPADEQLIQISTTQFAAPLTSSLDENDGGKLDVAAAPTVAGLIVDQANVDDEQWTIRSQWRWGGFRYESGTSVDTGNSTILLIPHWSIVLPLCLLSLAAFFGRGVSRVHSSAVVAALPRAKRAPAIERGDELHRIFLAGRGACAIVVLVASLALTAAWVRSAGMTDMVNIVCGRQTQLRMVSGKEGAVCQLNFQGSEDSRSSYRILTGGAHERLRFRMSTGLEEECVHQIETITPAGGQAEFLLAANAVQTADQATEFTNLPAAVSSLAFPGSGVTEWVGVSFDWNRLFISHDNPGSTVVVPYVFLVIPLTLVSALLMGSFVRSRRRGLIESNIPVRA
jgi:hypothetical protein